MRQRKSLPFAMAIAALCWFQCLAAQEKPIAILHARLIDGLGGQPIEDATMILRRNRIEYAGPANGARVPPDSQLIEGKGNSMMPGLADMHVHLQGGWDGIST